MQNSTHRRFFGGLAISIAILAAFMAAAEEEDGVDSLTWRTHVNREHSYLIRYPSAWRIEVGPTVCDRQFCSQVTELEMGNGATVWTFVNFMGGWCESTRNVLENDIEVGGFEGVEYICSGFTIRSFGPGDSIIRYFEGANGQINYFVLGQAPPGRLDLVEAIVRSFRILREE